MSHISTVKGFTIMDLTAFEAACRQRGMRFLEGAREWTSYYGKKPCLHAVEIEGAKGGYQIALERADAGEGYKLTYDSWGPGKALEEKCGAGLLGLQDAYAEQAAMQIYGQALPGETPWQIEREQLEDGRVRLRITR